MESYPVSLSSLNDPFSSSIMEGSSQTGHKWILFMQLDTSIGYLLSIINIDGWKTKNIKRYNTL